MYICCENNAEIVMIIMSEQSNVQFSSRACLPNNEYSRSPASGFSPNMVILVQLLTSRHGTTGLLVNPVNKARFTACSDNTHLFIRLLDDSYSYGVYIQWSLLCWSIYIVNASWSGEIRSENVRWHKIAPSMESISDMKFK